MTPKRRRGMSDLLGELVVGAADVLLEVEAGKIRAPAASARVSDAAEDARKRAKTRALWIDLHPVLADALEDQLGAREDRNLQVRLFRGPGADALRTSIAKERRPSVAPVWPRAS